MAPSQVRLEARSAKVPGVCNYIPHLITFYIGTGLSGRGVGFLSIHLSRDLDFTRAPSLVRDS